MSRWLQRRLRRYGAALHDEARAATPMPDFEGVLARMERDRDAEVIPFPRSTEFSQRRPRPSRYAPLGWALVGAAAGIVLLLGIAAMMGSLRTAAQADPTPSMSTKTARAGEESALGSRRAPAEDREFATEPDSPPAQTPSSASPAKASLDRPLGPPPRPASSSAKRPAPPTNPTADGGTPQPQPDPWAARNEQALRAWKTGNERRARRIFEKVAAAGPDSYAQLAFGELSMLIQQLDGAQAQRALWRRYLERFPRGRYADDWSAGLCRVAEAEHTSTCWTRYLLDHPHGSHVDHAHKALGAEP